MSGFPLVKNLEPRKEFSPVPYLDLNARARQINWSLPSAAKSNWVAVEPGVKIEMKKKDKGLDKVDDNIFWYHFL